MIVADSDVLIDFLRNGGAAPRVMELLKKGVLCTTAISAFELQSGISSKKALKSALDLLAAVKIFPLDDAAAKIAAEIYRELSGQGQGIGMGDSLIAGICCSNDLPILTRNLKHFDRVEGLVIAS